MPDPGMMLKDLDGYRGNSRRPWLLIVGSVILVTLGAILLLRYLEQLAPEKGPEVTQVSERSPAELQKTDTTKPPVATSSAVAKLLEQAQSDEARDQLQSARTNYLAILARQDSGPARPFVETRLAAVNVALVTTPREMPEKSDYAIRSGDSVKALANRYKCTQDLIIKGNNIPNPDRIQIGDRLRILDNPAFAIEVSKQKNELLLTLNGQFFKRYTVGTGKYGRTPEGTFELQEKIENPPWWRPDGSVVNFGDPENILGTRWMSLKATGKTPPAKGYGIHGTTDPSTLGKQSSAGCIRMRNSEVEELYMLVPAGTPVTIFK